MRRYWPPCRRPGSSGRSSSRQDRRAAMEIRREIQAAGPDRAKQAPIEAGLIGVIQDPASTLAGKQEAARLLWVCIPPRVNHPTAVPMLTGRR